MSTLREVPGPRITPFLQILYGLFNLLLIGGLVYSFKNTGGFHHKLSSSPKNLSSGLMHQHDACPPVPAAKRVEKVVEGAVLDSWHASYKPLHSPNRFPRCSMDVCFNFSRCDNMDELLVYHYDEFNPPKWFFEALKATPYSTSDPEKACIFLVTVDRRMEEPRIPDLKTLPHWNHGMNHVLISFVDNWSKWRNPMPATLEKAAIMTSITHQTTYRPAFDISVPLPALKYYEDLQELKAFQRKYFLTFKGTRYLSEFGGGGFRSHPSMRGMHNGKDVIVVTTCRQVSNNAYLKKHPELVPECDENHKVYKKYSFGDLMNSTFGLAPAGRGPSSFRLLEILSAGSIPVLVSDNFVLPFDMLIQWERCVLMFPTTEMHRILPTLRALKDEEVEFRREYCVFIYREFLETDQKLVATVMLALKTRFYGMLPRLAHKIPVPAKYLRGTSQQQPT